MTRISSVAPIGARLAIVPGIVLLGLSAPISVRADTEKPIYGAYDFKTHVFTPAAPLAAAATAPIVRKGTLTIEVSVDLKAVPAQQQVLAFVSAYLYDSNYQNSVGNSGPMKRSGSTGTVTFTIPYVFTVQNASEMVTVSVQLATQMRPYPSAIVTKQIPLPDNSAKTVVAFPAAL